MTNHYTVYFDHKKIAFLPKGIIAKNCDDIQIKDSLSWNRFISFTKDEIQVLHCLSDDPTQSFRAFKRNFQLLKAAGGLVVNDCGQWLFIYRNDRWDLPKGLIETGEVATASAMREVREECGIHAIKIVKPLADTHHVYRTENGEWTLKETHWYLMRAAGNEELQPQTAEGITMAAWVDPEKLNKITENTYGSIKDLIQHNLLQPMTGRCSRA